MLSVGLWRLIGGWGLRGAVRKDRLDAGVHFRYIPLTKDEDDEARLGGGLLFIVILVTHLVK